MTTGAPPLGATYAPPVTIPVGELAPADYLRLARALRAGGPGQRHTRLAALASYSLNFSEPFLLVEGARRGRTIECHFGAFGQLEQALLDPDAPLYRFAPDVLLLAMRLEDVDPDAVVRFHATGGRRLEQVADDLAERLARAIEAFRRRSSAPVLVANHALPALLPLGPFDANVGDSLTYAVARANARLRERLTALPGVAVWDYAGLVRAHGEATWTDPRLWALARVPVAARVQPALAAHLARTIDGVLRVPAKCLVLDLDNTIWGGVIGDDGLEGIRLGDDHPGSAFKSFQRRALALRDRGVLLAVVSKNDLPVVEQAFREHPEMLIRLEHLAAIRANWSPKSGNLREIARELNIGADALVLFDDNPVERAEVRANAPEVGVVEVPTDPLGYEAALVHCGYFDQPSLSDEDRVRAESYRQERERQTASERFADVEDFLASLEMAAVVGHVGPATIGRVAQLVGKTNQFNLTTRRHSQADIAAMCAEPSHVVGCLRLRDRFGDQGLVCVAVLRREGGDAVVDSFLMSCRVMNRRVEHAMMAFLAEQARALGCTRLVGEYLPTAKNGMVREFYPSLGFEAAGDAGQGGSRWTRALDADVLPWPRVIAREQA